MHFEFRGPFGWGQGGPVLLSLAVCLVHAPALSLQQLVEHWLAIKTHFLN